MLPPPTLFVDNAVGSGGVAVAAAGWCCRCSPPMFAPRRDYY